MEKIFKSAELHQFALQWVLANLEILAEQEQQRLLTEEETDFYVRAYHTLTACNIEIPFGIQI